MLTIIRKIYLKEFIPTILPHYLISGHYKSAKDVRFCFIALNLPHWSKIAQEGKQKAGSSRCKSLIKIDVKREKEVKKEETFTLYEKLKLYVLYFISL